MNLLKSNKVSNKSFLFLLGIAWLSVQLFLFSRYGIGTEYEARKYIDQAGFLIENGNLSHPSMWLYSTQILLIAAAKVTGTGYMAVVLLQLLLNALATYFLYRLFVKFSNEFTAFILTLLFILNFPFQTFNTTLYTESIFFSLLILFSCYLFRLKTLTTGSATILVAFILIICFTRPSGLLLVPCVFFYLFSNFFMKAPFILKATVTITVSVLFLFILNKAVGVGGELDFMLPFKEEHIICGLPTKPGNELFLAEPNSVFGIFNYVLQHPVQFARLAMERTIAFFGLTRPYYSTGHNIYLVLYFFPVYLLLLFSIKTWWKKNRGVLLYCVSFIGLTWGTVILTCDDWHNRFFLTILPFLYLLSLPALHILLKKFSKK